MAPSPVHRAVILAVGSELTTGETRDTNGGDLAADLSRIGVQVVRILQLPDDLHAVAAAFRQALDEADLIISSGGLGPTPDDLTREALAAALAVAPRVDPSLERALIEMFERRGLRMPEANRKQAWLIPGAEPLRNAHGTAPGWWVERGDRLVVTLPGPPRELRPMWAGAVLPRLLARGIGAEVATRTLRLTGIGESHVADALGEPMLRAENPVVATYARPDAVDVRITARPEPRTPAHPEQSAEEVLARTQAAIEARLGSYVFAYDNETWADALGRRLGDRRVVIWEHGTGGALVGLLGEAPWLASAEVVGPGNRVEQAFSTDPAPESLAETARAIRRRAGVPIALALAALPHGADLEARVAMNLEGRTREGASTVFLDDTQGRRRAALAACAALWETLGTEARTERGHT
ncbi:MAG: competence/damage-inducible protein A [Candidatus Limnocylindrales bacterium]